MNIYLIDFENVNSEGISGVNNLSACDRVIIFYSALASKLSMRAHIQLSNSAAKIEYVEVSTGGKNALDYQLSTYLGYLVGTKACDEYFIVSKDQGFNHIARFWSAPPNPAREYAVSIRCISSIKMAKINNDKAKADEPAADEAPVREEREKAAEVTPEPKPAPEEPDNSAKPGRKRPRPSRNRHRKPALPTAETTPEPAKATEAAENGENSSIQMPDISGETPLAAVTADPEPQPTARATGIPEGSPSAAKNQALLELLVSHPQLNREELFQLINEDRKNSLYQRLRAALGQEQGKSLYTSIKTLIWTK